MKWQGKGRERTKERENRNSDPIDRVTDHRNLTGLRHKCHAGEKGASKLGFRPAGEASDIVVYSVRARIGRQSQGLEPRILDVIAPLEETAPFVALPRFAPFERHDQYKFFFLLDVIHTCASLIGTMWTGLLDRLPK